MKAETKAMRDVFIEELCLRMEADERLFFLSADFGSPRLDRLKSDFKDRFINVGIAEQNLVNLATGLALEGFIVYAYAIAPFITMRACEQVRTNLSLLPQTREINVNLVGVGAGLSYGLSGPSHHCLEDISIMRTLPGITIFSPSDWVLARKFVDYSVRVTRPKYLRFDGKPLKSIYQPTDNIELERGFFELRSGGDVTLVSTGFMTHLALKAARSLKKEKINVGVIDVFLLRPFRQDLFLKTINRYQTVITLEEAFINKGGLDSMVAEVLRSGNSEVRLERMGFKDKHVFEVGSRDYLMSLNKLDSDSIIRVVKKFWGSKPESA